MYQKPHNIIPAFCPDFIDNLQKTPKNFYPHNIRLITSKSTDLPLSIEFLTMSVNLPPQQNRQVSES